MTETDINILKQKAAIRAVDFVQSGMVVGLGYGSTAIWAVREIARRIQTGELKQVLGVPCALKTEAEARQLGIPLTTLEDHSQIDVTIDGADEVDPDLNLIKGGGGALLREKIVAQASRREIIIVDDSKVVPLLGTKWAVPVEVIPFGHGSQRVYLESLGAVVKVRQNHDATTYKTDQGNIIMDCNFGTIHDPRALAYQLKARKVIVELGLFIYLAKVVIVADTNCISHFQL